MGIILQAKLLTVFLNCLICNSSVLDRTSEVFAGWTLFIISFNLSSLVLESLSSSSEYAEAWEFELDVLNSSCSVWVSWVGTIEAILSQTENWPLELLGNIMEKSALGLIDSCWSSCSSRESVLDFGGLPHCLRMFAVSFISLRQAAFTCSKKDGFVSKGFTSGK